MINSNYFKIRNAITRGLNEKDTYKTEKELKRYEKAISSFTPHQMGLFDLLVEQAATLKAEEFTNRLANNFNNAFIGFLSEQPHYTWDDVLKDEEVFSKMLIEEGTKETKIYNECKGDMKKVGNIMKKSIEQAEKRVKELIQEGKNQKQAIEILKDEFKELSNNILASTYKKIKKDAEVEEINEIIDIAVSEIKNEEEVLITRAEVKKEIEAKQVVVNNVTTEKVKTSTLKVVNKVIELDGENGKYSVNTNYGVRLELAENILEFKTKDEAKMFIDEVFEALEMV